ncbi:hypothetical protein F5Y16DRAFT_376435 [Xylariaceae sp. FL0255]|nr:hypothetical protein F5Y16DRAFT_376435 [Xylariaceae sp. FL0255]
MASDREDSDHEEGLSFTSPSEIKTAPKDSKNNRPKTPSSDPNKSRYNNDDPEAAREAALRRELDGVRNINELIEGVVGTLERAKGNMQTVSNTVTTASTLLTTWTRILSQTEHNQRLILNPTWKGASTDIAEVEAEAVAKQAAADRKAAEDERRRMEFRRRADEEARARESSATTASDAGSTTVGRGAASGRTTRTGVSRSRVGSVRGRGTRGMTGARRGTTTSATTAAAGRGETSTSDTTSSSIASARSTSKIGRAFLRAGSRGTRGY